MGIDIFLHLVDEPRLQLFLILQRVVGDALLAVGTFLPVVLGHLVATDVHISIGEEGEHFFPHVAAELQRRLLAGT